MKTGVSPQSGVMQLVNAKNLEVDAILTLYLSPSDIDYIRGEEARGEKRCSGRTESLTFLRDPVTCNDTRHGQYVSFKPCEITGQ
jgi:hypothetical protein